MDKDDKVRVLPVIGVIDPDIPNSLTYASFLVVVGTEIQPVVWRKTAVSSLRHAPVVRRNCHGAS